MADLIGTGAHLVGESYSAVVVLLAAALSPEAVLSLTVVEPPLFSLVQGNPAADCMARRANYVFETMRHATPEEFAPDFDRAVGFETLPKVMDPGTLRDIRSMMRERVPTDAQVPYDRLMSAPFRKMVISGGWSEVFEAICDELAGKLGAEHVVLHGQGHSAYLAGEPFNTVLERFIVGSGIV